MRKTAEPIIGSSIYFFVTVIAPVLLIPAVASTEKTSLTDKTLIVWASPANLTQRGGSALTVNDTTIDRFDGVVFAELESSVWMPGSNNHSRTHKGQSNWPKETAAGGDTKTLKGIVGDSCELEITIDPTATAKQFGVKVRASARGEEETLLYYDAEAKHLVFDSTKSGVDGRRKVERAPLKLKDGESLSLRVFVDKSVVEVYANDRQAICRRVYPGRDDSLGAALFANGGKAEFSSVKAWEMMPSNPY